MPLERDPATLLDMVIAGRRIQESIAGQDFAAFSSGLKTQSAVILQILLLGKEPEGSHKGSGTGIPRFPGRT